MIAAAKRSDRIARWESDLGTTGVVDDELNLPDKAIISSIYPNPFNPSATVSFVIPYETDVTLEIHDSPGRKVRTLYSVITEPDRHNITIDGSTLASNIYFVAMKTERFFDSGKIVPLK
ncbi:MAG: T9SS type A sorting domain-containing protein [Candidatus Zixiibacteriota bacterium]|nr:MAG: T9SS type A sorting domain-containing protein [candidate division Zixibacteria bacterium]